MHIKIKEKTDDRITIDRREDKVSLYFSIGLGIFIIGVFVIVIWNSHEFQIPSHVNVFLLIFVGLICWFLIYGGIYGLLVSETVTIDKKSQNLIIKKDSKINHFKSVREIPFINLKKVKIVIVRCKGDSDWWNVSLIPMWGNSFQRLLHNVLAWNEGLISYITGSYYYLEQFDVYSTDSESNAVIFAEKICKITSCKEFFREVREYRAVG